MKRTCDKCRALEMTRGEQPSCSLEYQIDPKLVAPLEPCPKPLVYLDLIEARSELAERRACRQNQT